MWSEKRNEQPALEKWGNPHRGGRPKADAGNEETLEKCCEQGGCQMQGTLKLNGLNVKLLPRLTICPSERLAGTSIGNRKAIRWSLVISARDRLVYLKVIYIIVISNSSQTFVCDTHMVSVGCMLCGAFRPWLEIPALKSHFVPLWTKVEANAMPHDASWLITLQRDFCLGIKDYFKHYLPASLVTKGILSQLSGADRRVAMTILLGLAGV